MIFSRTSCNHFQLFSLVLLELFKKIIIRELLKIKHYI